METQITSPHGSIILRPAKEADVQAYRKLHLEALRNHPEAFSSDYAANEQKPMAHFKLSMKSRIAYSD